MSTLASGLAVAQMLFLRLKLEVTDRDVDQQSAGMLESIGEIGLETKVNGERLSRYEIGGEVLVLVGRGGV